MRNNDSICKHNEQIIKIYAQSVKLKREMPKIFHFPFPILYAFIYRINIYAFEYL